MNKIVIMNFDIKEEKELYIILQNNRIEMEHQDGLGGEERFYLPFGNGS